MRPRLTPEHDPPEHEPAEWSADAGTDTKQETTRHRANKIDRMIIFLIWELEFPEHDSFADT